MVGEASGIDATHQLRCRHLTQCGSEVSIDHEWQARGARGREEALGAREVGAHRLLHHDRQTSLERAHRQCHRGTVVREDEEGVEITSVE